MKQLINQAYEAGKRAFGKYGCAPCLNLEFMSTVPNCQVSDIKGIKLRAKMYKSYIKGWTESNLIDAR